VCVCVKVNGIRRRMHFSSSANKCGHNNTNKTSQKLSEGLAIDTRGIFHTYISFKIYFLLFFCSDDINIILFFHLAPLPAPSQITTLIEKDMLSAKLIDTNLIHIREWIAAGFSLAISRRLRRFLLRLLASNFKLPINLKSIHILIELVALP
jgi:hypothetical protein